MKFRLREVICPKGDPDTHVAVHPEHCGHTSPKECHLETSYEPYDGNIGKANLCSISLVVKQVLAKH